MITTILMDATRGHIVFLEHNSQDYSLFLHFSEKQKNIFITGYLLLVSVHLALRVYFIIATVSRKCKKYETSLTVLRK